MDAKEDQDAPDLLESNELIRHLATPENLVNAIDDDPIRTKDSFQNHWSQLRGSRPRVIFQGWIFEVYFEWKSGKIQFIFQ